MPQNYSDKIKDHYHNPRNAGKLDDADFVAEQINPFCGDETRIYIKYSNARGREHLIENISHETRGCMICVAAASVISEYAKGKTLSEIKKLESKEIEKMLGVEISQARASCATLVIKAFRVLE